MLSLLSQFLSDVSGENFTHFTVQCKQEEKHQRKRRKIYFSSNISKFHFKCEVILNAKLQRSRGILFSFTGEASAPAFWNSKTKLPLKTTNSLKNMNISNMTSCYCIEVLHGSHVAWQEQWKCFALERTFVPIGKIFYCSCHAKWLLCKTSILAVYFLPNPNQLSVNKIQADTLEREILWYLSLSLC